MRLAVEQAPFATWLKRTANVADTRSPALLNSSLLLDVSADQRLTLWATNDLYSITGEIPLFACDDGSGAIATDASRLSDLVASSRTDVPVGLLYNPGEPRLRVSSGRATAKLPVSDPAALPRFTTPFDVDPQLFLSAKELAAALAFTAPAIGRSPDQAQLWGVAFNFDPTDGGAAFAAAQEGRLGAVWQLDATGEAFATTLLPRPLCHQLWRFCKDEETQIAITFTSRAVRIATPEWTIISKIVDSEPPRWNLWLPPRCAQPVTVDSAELAAALERVEAVAEIDNKRLNSRGALLTFDSGTILLRDAKSTIEDEVAAHFVGAPERVGVNIQHLLTIIKTIGAKTIELHTDGPERAIRVQATDDPRGAFVTASYRIS